MISFSTVEKAPAVFSQNLDLAELAASTPSLASGSILDHYNKNPIVMDLWLCSLLCPSFLVDNAISWCAHSDLTEQSFHQNIAGKSVGIAPT